MMVNDYQGKVVDINCGFCYCSVTHLFIPLTLLTMVVDDDQWKVVDINCVFGYCTVSNLFIPLLPQQWSMMINGRWMILIVSFVTVLSVISLFFYLYPLLSQQ